ncbi:MAG: hypothetical protein ACP5M9_01645 [Candidatus Micrarchaeia archaeon]
MKIKLTNELCYLSGLVSRFREDNNAIGIKTNRRSMEENFISLVLKFFKIPPNKLVIEENDDGSRHIFFYHSKINREIKYVLKNKVKLFKFPTPQSRSYLGGLFDASGHFNDNIFSINALSLQDKMIFENLGVHLSGSKILSQRTFYSLIKGFSVLSEELINKKGKSYQL